MARGRSSRRGRPRTGGKKGYNPNRAGDGRFASGPHKKRISKIRRRETALRKKSVETKRQMADVKRQARGKSDTEKARLRRKFDKLAAKREAIKAKIAETKGQKDVAKTDMRRAKKEHVAAKRKELLKRRAEREEAKRLRRETKTQDLAARRSPGKPETPPPPTPPKPKHEYQFTQPSSDDKQRHAVVTGHRKDAEQHFAEGRLHEGRKAMERAMESYGLAKHPLRNLDEKTEITDSLQSNVKSAIGERDWEGNIRVNRAMGDKLREFSIEQRSRQLTGRSSTDQTSDSKDNYYGMHVMVHEVNHGFGPTDAIQYRGKGVVIEEVTTETVSRKFMAEHYGTDRERGSYGQYINNTRIAVMRHLDVDFETSKKIVEDASFKFKKIPMFRNWKSSGEPVDLFFEILGPGRLSKKEFEDAL